MNSHRHRRPSLGLLCSPAHNFPNISAELFDLTISGRIAKKLFSPFGQLGNGSTESLRGLLEAMQQDRGRAGLKPPAPSLPLHSPAWLCCGSSRHYLFPLVFMHSTFGTGPLVIKAPRDRKAQLKHSQKNKKENKTTASTGTSPGGSTGVLLRT